MRLAYYPGCSAKGSSADYEMSTQAVCGALGMRLEELPDWNCCGSTPAHAVDTELSAALCVRNLDITDTREKLRTYAKTGLLSSDASTIVPMLSENKKE